jgi:hypothetical protein
VLFHVDREEMPDWLSHQSAPTSSSGPYQTVTDITIRNVGRLMSQPLLARKMPSHSH